MRILICIYAIHCGGQIMLEIKNDTPSPKILVIGIGGGGNNAINRMMQNSQFHVTYAAINTDIQVLENCLCETKLQIGKKLTSGYGAGSDPLIGAASAEESEAEIETLIEGANMVILTCGMGGGTGTGAIPIIAKQCKDAGILTVAVVTKPFTFEGLPKASIAETGLENLQKNVDTLLIIPNDKLLNIANKPFYLEDAFLMADNVLKYTIEGITNIIFNKGTINLDFNDLKTILGNKGLGHLGIGTVDTDGSIMEAVKIAINSPLLETNIAGASHILLNSSGKVNLLELNEAINYIQEIVGKNVNILWGTVMDTANEGQIIVTLIATGLKSPEKKSENIINTPPVRQPFDKNKKIHFQNEPITLHKLAPIHVPEFLQKK